MAIIARIARCFQYASPGPEEFKLYNFLVVAVKIAGRKVLKEMRLWKVWYIFYDFLDG